MIKKLLSFSLAFSLLTGLSASAIPYNEYMAGRNEYTSAAYTISPGLTYTEYLTENAKYGYERAFVYEYTPMMGTTVIPSSGNYVYGTTSLGTITKQLEKDGVRVVGGINGDFYSTTTGVPIGAMIIDREIYSSDNDRTAMGFDKEGRAFISKPEISVKLTNDSNDITLEHINKYPLEYALYLLTDRFYPTTKTTLASTEIVLMPYSDVTVYNTEEEAEKEISADDSEDKKAETEENGSDVGNETKTEEKSEGSSSDEEAPDDQTNRSETPTETESETESEAETEKQENYFWLYSSDITNGSDTNETVEENENATVGDERQDGAGELPEPENDISETDDMTAAADKEQQITTDSDEEQPENNANSESDVPLTDSENTDETEEPDKTEETDEDQITDDTADYYAKRYTVSDEKLTVGGNIKVVVKEIRLDSTDSPIPEGCFVICAENVYQRQYVSHIKQGDEFTLSITAAEEWYDAVHAIGNSGGLILKDGEYCDDVEIDHYPYAHPRTAAGITADGRVIFYCVDGRQKHSGGLRIDQLSHEMKELGCMIAMNLDGGGSTTAYAALPGESFSTLKNSPSGMVERKTANSLLFINTAERGNKATRFTFYPERPYVVCGGSEYILPKPSATDENYYPIDLADDFVYEYYTSPIQTDSVIVDQNRFISGEKCGPVKVYVHVEQNGETLEYMAGTVFVLSHVSGFSFDSHEYSISPFETVDLGFKAEYHTAELFYDENSLKWSFPEEIIEDTDREENSESEGPDEENEEELFERQYFKLTSGTSVENDLGIISLEEGFTPKVHGTTVSLFAKFGDLTDSVTVNIERFPFDDSFSHWSAKNLYEMYGFDLMRGENDIESEKVFFFPDRNMTKAEFVTVLARILYPDIDKSPEPDLVESDAQESQTESEEPTEVTESDVLTEESFETSETEETPDINETDATQESDVPAETDSEETDPVEEIEGAELTDEPELPPEEQPTFSFADASDIPEWALKYFEALSETELLDLLVKTDENGELKLYPNENITRYDVLVLLGALCDEVETDMLEDYADANIFAASPHRALINNALSAGIFEGYEDNTLRPQNRLTRAEAATVVLRFYKIKYLSNE